MAFRALGRIQHYGAVTGGNRMSCLKIGTSASMSSLLISALIYPILPMLRIVIAPESET